jgi:hypothetical protein
VPKKITIFPCPRNKPVVIPAKAGIQSVYVIAPEGRDTMQVLDARLRGHDSEAGSDRPSSQATS